MSKLTTILAGVTLAASLGAWSQAYGDLQYSLVPVGTFTGGAITLNLEVTSNVGTAQFYDGYGSLTASAGTFSAFTLDGAFPISFGNDPGSGAGASVTAIKFHATDPIGNPVGVSINTGTSVILGSVVYTPSGSAPFTVTFNPRIGFGGIKSQVWTQGTTEFDDLSNPGNISSPALVLSAASGLTVNSSGTASPPNTLVGTPGTPATITASGLAAFSTSTIAVNSGAELQITTNASARQTAGVVTKIDGSQLTLVGKIDQTNNDLIFNNTTLGAVQGYVASTSLITSAPGTVVAVALASDLGVATFDTVGVVGGDVLAKDTYAGDANFSGSVTAADLGILLANFNATTSKWTSGNFAHNATVGPADLGLLLANFNQGVASPLASPGPVPEPASLGLLALGAVGLVARRKR